MLRGLLRERMGGGQRGQTTAEFVVVFPMLLLLFFLMVEFGWMLKNYLVVTNAGRDVARCVAVDGCHQDPRAVAEERIEDGAAIHPDDDIQFSIHWIDYDGSTDLNMGDSVIVCIESPNRAATPLLVFASMAGVVPDPVPLTARTEMRLQADSFADADLSGPQDNNQCTPT